ncbi:glycoside hydrolase family 10 protein [Streptomyces sp. YIM 98790]|uniref:glycoside hydrolase family 10 protein n=1 Tax=Streptomyces sp. YIM 98790 TaxID=2689077 RepID=UPI00140CF9E7|nr:family 10 glycosylhydrolase [Streptomyces sp. YIM 98790]
MGRMTRRTFTLATAGTLAGFLALRQAEADSAAYGPAGEGGGVAAGRAAARDGLRGTWISTVGNLDWPSGPGLPPAEARQELSGLLDEAVRYRLNAVFLQVRPTADAFWPSPHEPWSAWLTGTQGKDPGWDPLDFAVRAAHDRGLELHAWFNPYRIALHDDPSRLAAEHPARRQPEWVVSYGGRLYFNPGIPEVRRHVQNAMLHAVENYPVDGVHFDDYFYPYPVQGETFDDDAAFARHGGTFTDRGDWRRENVNLLIREVQQRVREVRPGAVFGVSPFGIWRNSGTDPKGSRTSGLQTYDDLYADTRRWVREGRLDYVLPQVYWHIGHSAADYAELVPWWSAVAEGTGVRLYIGEALYKVGDPAQPEQWSDPAELSRHLTFCRDHPQVAGHVFFSAAKVAADPLGAMSRVREDHYQEPAASSAAAREDTPGR